MSWRKVFIAWSGGGKQSQRSACGHITSLLWSCSTGCTPSSKEINSWTREFTWLPKSCRAWCCWRKKHWSLCMCWMNVNMFYSGVMQLFFFSFFFFCYVNACDPCVHLDSVLSSEYHEGYACETLGKGEEKLCIISKYVCEHQWVQCEIPVTESSLQLLLWLIMTVLHCKTLEAVDPHYHWFNTRLRWNKAASLRYSVVSKRG